MRGTAQEMLDALERERGAWVSWRECVPGLTDPSQLVYGNELRAAGHHIERHGRREAEEYGLSESVRPVEIPEPGQAARQ